jgi:TRAP-type C4-dicarboxylate transport system substrate-binding protein
MKLRKWIPFILLTALIMAIAVLAGCGGGADETTTTAAPAGDVTTTSEAEATPDTAAETGEKIKLKYAFFAGPQTFPAVQMEKWAEEIEKRTNGQVEVETFPGGTLLTPQNMFDGVLQGVADIGLSCPTYEPGRFPLLSLNDLAGVYPNAEVASKSFFTLVQEFEPEELKQFKVVTAFATEPAYIASSKKVTSLADLKGLELRTAGGPKVLDALGAKSVSMPMSELGPALQTGVVDGYASSREVLKDYKFAETTKYVVEYPLTQISFLALMSQEKWDSLPANVQQVIDELAAEMAEFAGSYLDQHVQESLEWSQGAGLEVQTLSADEAGQWDAALQPVTEQVIADVKTKGLPADEFFARMKELGQK